MEKWLRKVTVELDAKFVMESSRAAADFLKTYYIKFIYNFHIKSIFIFIYSLKTKDMIDLTSEMNSASQKYLKKPCITQVSNIKK